jgi:chemotaxis response regulator CheB
LSFLVNDSPLKRANFLPHIDNHQETTMPGKGKKRNAGASLKKGRGKKKPAGAPVDSNRKHPDQQYAEQEEKRTRQDGKQIGFGRDAEEKPPEPESVAASGTEPSKPPEDTGPGEFPIIGIGASAGGLAALEAFFAALPENSGIAFVVINHTGSEHASLLPDILRRKARVSVREIKDGLPLAPDTIYIPPSDKDPIIANERFQLKQRPERKELHMPVDRFLRHLAEERGERAGCVILSGTGTDGTQGLRSIKEQAGVALAQSQQSAQHAGMPTSAADTGLVDWVMAPEKMPERLIEYFKHPASVPTKDGLKGKKEPSDLRKILSFLANRTRHDFSLYKESTLVRRIQRRATVTRSRNATEYYKILHRDPDEAWALFQDLLIGVTNFFPQPGDLRLFQAGSAAGADFPLAERSRPARVGAGLCHRGGSLFGGHPLPRVPGRRRPRAESTDLRPRHRFQGHRKSPPGRVSKKTLPPMSTPSGWSVFSARKAIISRSGARSESRSSLPSKTCCAIRPFPIWTCWCAATC